MKPTNYGPLSIVHQYIAHTHNLFQQRPQVICPSSSNMNFMLGVIILLHPIAALVLIWTFMKQRKWRQDKNFLKEQKYQSSFEKHRLNGDRLMLGTIFVILLAVVAEITRAWFDKVAIFTYIIPNNFHASGGLLGLLLMGNLWKLGHSSNNKRKLDSFSKTRDLHGRLSDVMSILIIIHAFLGFLYLLQII